MTVYCFRAEAGVDVDDFFTHLDLEGIDNSKLDFAQDDVTTGGLCDFSADADLDTVLDCARRVVDGHVIVRTLREGSYRDTDMADVREG